MGRHHFFSRIPTWMFRDRFPSVDRIARVGSPLLVIAGTADTVVPVSQSQQLFQAAREPKRLLILEGADHNDEALAAGPQVVAEILGFLRTIGPYALVISCVPSGSTVDLLTVLRLQPSCHRCS